MSPTGSMDETAPLLPNARRTQQQLNVHSLQNFPEVAGENRTIGPRLVASLVIDSIPVILSYILQNSIQTVSIVITGRLGPEELSAAAFSMMLAYVTGE